MTKNMTFLASAALVLMAAIAHAQTWEINQYFGIPSVSPPVAPQVGNPVQPEPPTILVTPGTTVYLPVFIRMQRGDSTFSPQLLDTFLYGVSGVTYGGASAGDFTAKGTNRPLGVYIDPTLDLSPSPDPPLPGAPGNFSLIRNMGYQFAPPGNTNVMGSLGQTLPYTDAANHAWWVGTVSISVSPAALNFGGIDLYFRTGQAIGPVESPYLVPDQTTAATTVGYGWDAAANTPDFHMFGTTTPVNGRAYQRFSSLPDARIVVIPEPGAILLLSLAIAAGRALGTRNGGMP